MPLIQGCSQPHSPGWARVPLSSFFLKFRSVFLIYPQSLLIFSSFWPSGWVPRLPGKALATPLLWSFYVYIVINGCRVFLLTSYFIEPFDLKRLVMASHQLGYAKGSRRYSFFFMFSKQFLSYHKRRNEVLTWLLFYLFGNLSDNNWRQFH